MIDKIDVRISFDTTGSMYPCLTEVRRRIKSAAEVLFKNIPNLQIGLIAHGDYVDARDKYVTKHLDLTSDVSKVVDFAMNTEATWGGDAPECYELVLREAHTKCQWREGSHRILIMIGDSNPHSKMDNPGKIDWREELTHLAERNIAVYGVHALGNRSSENFYQTISDRTGGICLPLSQFSEAHQLIAAVIYKQQSPEALNTYEETLVTEKKLTRSMSTIFDKLNKRDAKGRYRKVDARAVDAGRFQRIEVDADMPIKQLVQESGLIFKIGRGFYEFTKKETIQAKKQVIILDKETGDMYEGAAAREVLGLPEGVSIDIKPTYDRDRYTVFVQSTSVNRKLIGGTIFLYEVDSEA